MTAAAITLTEGGLTLSYDSSDPALLSLDAVDTAVRDLHDLRQVQAALKAWEGVLSDFLADALGKNAIEVEGVGQVVVKRGTDRKEWDKHSLLRVVLDSHRPPDESGELHGSDRGEAFVGDELVTCSADLSRVLDCFNLPAPRVTALKERGIDPGEFCESTPGKVSVVIE